MRLSQTEEGSAWISQFAIPDQPDAILLLDAIRWVSSAEFTSSLRASIEAEAAKIDGPIALFIERELRNPGGHLQRFYKESPTKPKRAHGAALQPVESIRAYAHEVGSEGIIATLATSVARANPSRFLLHPTAEDIRKCKIRAFFILTDTIGTGTQATNFLSSLWRVASVKSWFSSRLVSCHVIAFASTTVGEKHLMSHPMKPKVIWSLSCPTIENSFGEVDAQRLVSLCAKYNPVRAAQAFGFGGEGVLIAYPHGVPNNAPAILYKVSATWKPIFSGRAIGDVADALTTGFHEVEAGAQLIRMGQSRLAAAGWLDRLDADARRLVLVLASLSRSPRSENAVSTRTGLQRAEVRRLLNSAIHYGWITEQHRLTDDGMKQLQRLRAQTTPQEILHTPNDLPYYPQSLRASD
ncbi:hypothetical protein [Caballeronia sp. dw_19]|uniref:phosphoribosyltransferase-like protein n=1 Tax=Caballeronia sp. dw_19 TaxID=2719791 RepID=UPI001BD17E69|nr:hypothetical protein [Caballeronia sp. dw_19]